MTTALATRGDVTVDGEIVEMPQVSAPLTLFGTDDPAAVVERATRVASVLADVIKQRHLSVHIGNRDHVLLEGWTFLGTMLGVFGDVEWTRAIDRGWEARVVARTMAGAVVGSAEAMCTRAERTWANRDEYAIRSMAQTRALSKALRLPLGFIVELAGFAATPAEEMDGLAQPERGTVQRSGGTDRAPSPVQRTPEEQALLDELLAISGMTTARMSLLADAAHVAKGSRATAEQLREMIRIAQTPLDSPGRAARAHAEGSPAPASTSAPADEDAPASEGGGVRSGALPSDSDAASESSPSGSATSPAQAASPPGSPESVVAPATFTDPASLETYGAAVLGFEQPVPLKDWAPAEWDQVWSALGLGDPDAYETWYTALERPVRAALMTAHQSPAARRKAAKEAATAKPDAETLRMGLDA